MRWGKSFCLFITGFFFALPNNLAWGTQRELFPPADPGGQKDLFSHDPRTQGIDRGVRPSRLDPELLKTPDWFELVENSSPMVRIYLNHFIAWRTFDEFEKDYPTDEATLAKEPDDAQARLMKHKVSWFAQQAKLIMDGGKRQLQLEAKVKRMFAREKSKLSWYLGMEPAERGAFDKDIAAFHRTHDDQSIQAEFMNKYSGWFMGTPGADFPQHAASFRRELDEAYLKSREKYLNPMENPHVGEPGYYFPDAHKIFLNPEYLDTEPTVRKRSGESLKYVHLTPFRRFTLRERLEFAFRRVVHEMVVSSPTFEQYLSKRRVLLLEPPSEPASFFAQELPDPTLVNRAGGFGRTGVSSPKARDWQGLFSDDDEDDIGLSKYDKSRRAGPAPARRPYPKPRPIPASGAAGEQWAKPVHRDRDAPAASPAPGADLKVEEVDPE